MEAVGVRPSGGQEAEMVLRGGKDLTASALELDQLAPVLMARSDAWTPALDDAAANASRRLWGRRGRTS
ncbi:hypothetical protein NKH77_28840 [Streptomyces sp. M19]